MALSVSENSSAFGLAVAFLGLSWWAKIAMTMTLTVVIVVVMLVVLIVIIIAISGNRSTGSATNGTADNRAILSTNFIAHGGPYGATHTAADSGVQRVISGINAEWDG